MTPRDTKYQPGVCTALLAAVLMLLAVAVMLSGCSPTKYVPVETVRTEYRDREVEKIVADTVHDTRFVWVKGDTLVDIRETEHIRRVEIHDTCYIERTDTIRIPYPVEKHLTKWEQAKQDFGGFALGGVAIVICAVVVWLVRKFRK
ncbi:hypothetical protein [Paramuribaculum intestinale]|uniref:hypothetical protein n=1 Tax=Paramuribaculum intestinale TaxID=2094151 RepID=UPI0025AA156E|nr:hypothetical protein [Paramuribaculum intestinale]